MHILMRRLIALFLMLTLVGCDREALFEKFIPKDEEAIAKELIVKLSMRDYTAVEAQMDKSLRSSEIRSKLERIAELIPAEVPENTRTIGAVTNQVNGVTDYSLTFEHEYKDVWLVTNVVMRRSNDALTVTGIHVTPRKQSLETENAFSFIGKSWLHYVVFGLAVAVPLFIIYAIATCARTKVAKRKWLWLLFIALGMFQLQLNWTTGAWNIQPLYFLLLGAGFTKAAPAAPLILSVAFPLGALLFLLKNRSQRHADNA
jgi:hypothetical protein